MNKQKMGGHIAILISSTMSAINMPVSKSLISNNLINGYGLTLWRASVACLIFWVISLFFKREKVVFKDKMILAVGAFFGMSFNQLAFLIGLKDTATIDASIISSMTPVFVMIMAALVLSEPITLRKAFGVGIGMAGAMMIVYFQDGAHGSSSMWGIMLTTIAGISYAVYLIVNRSIVTRYSPITISKWMFLFAAMMLLPFGSHDLYHSRIFNDTVSVSDYMLLGFTALGASFLAYLLVPISLRYIRPTTVSMYNYLQPLIASSVAIFIGQDILTWQKPVAGIIIFIGVYFVTSSKSRQDMDTEKKEQLESDKKDQLSQIDFNK